MGPVEKILREAWAKIENPKNRCTSYFAFDKDGFVVGFADKEACKWCSSGALLAICQKHPYSLSIQAESFLYKAAKELGFVSVSAANDSDVINNPPKLYELAINAAAKEGE